MEDLLESYAQIQEILKLSPNDPELLKTKHEIEEIILLSRKDNPKPKPSEKEDMFAIDDDEPAFKKQKTTHTTPQTTKQLQQTPSPQSQPTPPPQQQQQQQSPQSIAKSVTSLQLPSLQQFKDDEEHEEDVEWDEYEVELTGEGSSNFDAIHRFNQFGFPTVLARNIKHIAQYKLPTPIQRYSIPVALSKRDLLATAQTGSGKTGAFLLPIISRLLLEGKITKPLSYFKVFPLSLILVPTRELALQIYQESIKYLHETGLVSIAVYGGTPILEQQIQLRSGCDILIATPGRLCDFLKSENISLSMCRFLCMDEADRMLDLGFEKEIRAILDSDLPKKVPTKVSSAHLFGATPSNSNNNNGNGNGNNIINNNSNSTTQTQTQSSTLKKSSLPVTPALAKPQQQQQQQQTPNKSVVGSVSSLSAQKALNMFQTKQQQQPQQQTQTTPKPQPQQQTQAKPNTPQQPAKLYRQTLMFSATMPKQIKLLADDLLSNPILIKVGKTGNISTITQIVKLVSVSDRREMLVHELKPFRDQLVIIFVRTKKHAETLTSFLRARYVKTTAIHGDRTQAEREEALRQFKNGDVPVLVATDVVSRGIHVDNIACVINYDLPESIHEYVHRIGRTGRAGKEGIAISYLPGSTAPNLAKALIKILERNHQNVPQFLVLCAKGQMSVGVGEDKEDESISNQPELLADDE